MNSTLIDLNDDPSRIGPPTNEKHLYDKTGRRIMVGDVLKVYHFTGERRKKYYMYKFVFDRKHWIRTGYDFLYISHLHPENLKSGYYECCNGQKLDLVEIVQGYGENKVHYCDRPKEYKEITADVQQ